LDLPRLAGKILSAGFNLDNADHIQPNTQIVGLKIGPKKSKNGKKRVLMFMLILIMTLVHSPLRMLKL